MKRFGAFSHRIARCRGFCVTPVVRQSWAAQSFRPWMCVKADCKKVNYARAQQCEGCGTDKPNLTRWICVDCNAENHKGVKFCKKCASPATSSSGYWACACCIKNNKIDDLDDVSTCSFCDYDMAPKNRSEEEALRIQQEISQRIREQQSAFDAPTPELEENPWATAGDSSAEAPSHASSTQTDALKPKRFDYKPFVFQEPKVAVSKLMRPRKPAEPIPDCPPGFDWMCRERQCGAMNKGDANVCVQCNHQIIPSEWECGTCAARNHWSRGLCFSCSTPITPSWLCNRCRTRTSIYDSECRSCNSQRPPVEPVDPRDVKSGKLAKGKGKKTTTDWVCEGCKAQNFSWRDRCFSCDMAKEPGAQGGMWTDGSGSDGSSVAAVNDNNWLCDSCHASNFRTRTECWQCGKGAVSAAIASDTESVPTFEKEGFQKGLPDAPAVGASKTWGPKNPEDWVCGKCFAKNFKSKTECHKCGTVKTVAAVTKKITIRKPVKI